MLRDPPRERQRNAPIRSSPAYTGPMPADPQSLHIRTYPDPVLRRKAPPLESVSDEVRAVAARMIELMFEAEGVGLAAPQVGLEWRLFVAHVPQNEDNSTLDDPPSATPEPQVYINPVLGPLEGDLAPSEEGCLSLPEIRGEVRRPPVATITALGLDGERFTATASGLLARCWQHEVDHLDGILIIDKMTQISRLRVRSAVKGLEKQARI
ncbi:MAG: peptide deformylase [Phycisphaeraceae bacterium]|nr:MAG: peptide deformylase [Phycisphaeraceae bacterium]